MSAVSMHVLMDVAIDSSARRERVGGLVADMASRRNLGNIDARQFGDVLRSAGLTINVDLGFLFGMNGPKPLLKAGGRGSTFSTPSKPRPTRPAVRPPST